MEKYQPLAGVLTESEVIEFLGLSKEQLSNLRHNKKLPFVNVNRNKRLYLEEHLQKWFRTNTITLDKDY